MATVFRHPINQPEQYQRGGVDHHVDDGFDEYDRHSGGQYLYRSNDETLNDNEHGQENDERRACISHLNDEGVEQDEDESEERGSIAALDDSIKGIRLDHQSNHHYHHDDKEQVPTSTQSQPKTAKTSTGSGQRNGSAVRAGLVQKQVLPVQTVHHSHASMTSTHAQVNQTSHSRTRSVDRISTTIGSSGRPYSPVVARARGRRGAVVKEEHEEVTGHGTTSGPEENGKEDKERGGVKVCVKEVVVGREGFDKPGSGGGGGGVDRVVPSPSRRRRESRNRDPHPHVTLYHHLHAHSPHPSTPNSPKLDVYTATIPTLVRALQSNAISSVGVVEAYLAQIAEHNETLRALCWVREREGMIREARERDQAIRRGWVDWERTPLWGVPIVVKDNIATDEELGMPTTAGSFALLGMPVKKDAFVVRKLRQAGAIILAKANMSELADYKSAHAGPGWSAVGGQTINVYAAHASPGTSSSGNGVAVAAGFCPASIGTETDGSITLPCLQSCLYGLKPTVGMLSRQGVVPFAPYFDTPGPMAKDVESLAVLMDVMQAEDEEDEKTLEVDRVPRGVRYIDSCENPTFEGLRIGIPRQNWHEIDPWRRPDRDLLVPELAEPFERVIQVMAGRGATVQDPADIPSAVDGSLWDTMYGARALVVAADCNHYLTKYLQGLGGEGGCRSVADIIAFNEEHADIEMPPGHHGQEVLKRTLNAAKVDSVEYAQAKAEMKIVAGVRGLDAIMDEYDLDALFMIREGHHSAANMVGYPIASVPIGLLSDNTPYGAFFIGRKHGEQTLLRIMAAWQATFGARPLPPIASKP